MENLEHLKQRLEKIEDPSNCLGCLFGNFLSYRIPLITKMSIHSPQCESTCIRDYLENSAYKKYGDCPKDPLNRLEAICFNTCQSTDYHCPGVEKCCPHSCGMSCQSPVGLSKVRGLPPVPFHVSLREAGRSFRMAEIHWDIALEEEESSAIYFVVESRHHIGINFAERKLENDWQSHTPVGIYEVKRTGSLKRYVGDMKLKPGRWYQVRVAAVNELGTRGYSVVSKEFQLSKSKWDLWADCGM